MVEDLEIARQLFLLRQALWQLRGRDDAAMVTDADADTGPWSSYITNALLEWALVFAIQYRKTRRIITATHSFDTLLYNMM